MKKIGESLFENKHLIIIVATFSLNFVIVPHLGDIDKLGKIFIFSFFVIILLFTNLNSNNYFLVSPIFNVFFLVWFVFFAMGVFSKNPYWTYLNLAIFALCLLFVLIVVHVAAQTDRFFEIFINTLLVTGVSASLLGLYEYFHFLFLGPSPGMLIPYLMPPDLSSRVVGPYGQPNLFAVFLTLVIIAFFYRYIHFAPKNESRIELILKYLPFVLVCFVFFQTGSKAGLLSVSLILGFLSWMVASGRYLHNNKNLKIEFLKLLFFFFLSFLLMKISSSFFVDTARSFEVVGISTDARFIFWSSAILMFLDHPWTGVGFGNYQFLQSFYNRASHDLLGFVPYEAMGNTNWAHNEYFQLFAEGGIIVAIIIVSLLLLYFFSMFKKFILIKNINDYNLFYIYIFVLPFLIQSFFSWPFRFPPLVILFFLIVGMLLSRCRLMQVRFNKFSVISIKSMLVLCFLMTCYFFHQEIMIGSLAKNLKSTNAIEETIPLFSVLVDRPYSQFRVLKGASPHYVGQALRNGDTSLALWVLPFCEELTVLQGARWQWYNLAQIYLKVGREEDARDAIQKTIDLMPSSEIAWDFLHYLNVLKASRETGKSVEEFYPNHDVDFIDFREVLFDLSSRP